MVKIKRSGKFERMLRDFALEDPELISLIDQSISWFAKNPKDTRLDNHPLRRRLKGRWAFSITEDIRIVYKWRGKNLARFLAIGSHPHVYGKEVKN